MNLKQAKIVLEKINTLHKSISIDEDSISSIERDLMLSYIRQLYENFLDDKVISSNNTKVNTAPKRVNTPKAVEPAPVVEEVRKKPIIIEIPDSLKEYAAPAAEPKAVVVETVPPPAETAPPAAAPKPQPKPKALPKHESLFEQKEAKELSERLGEMPIKDLTKAMGLNEKILTINELFGGDHHAFDNAVRELNTLSSFEEAKTFLSENLADKYAWADKSRKKKAQAFIKLIRRRYNK